MPTLMALLPNWAVRGRGSGQGSEGGGSGKVVTR